MRHRHRRVPFEEVHADVEIEAPVGLRRHHAGIHPQVVVALVEQREIALRLPRDVFHRPVGQRGFIEEDELLFDAQRLVDPVPVVAVAVQLEQVRIVFGLRHHDQFEQVPARQRHVRQRLAAQRIIGQNQGAVAHFRRRSARPRRTVFSKTDLRPQRQMRFHVHRIHVAVFVERERKAPDRPFGIPEGEVVAEGLVVELDGHLALLSVEHEGSCPRSATRMA